MESSMTFFDVLFGFGLMGTTTWLVVVFLGALALPLGLASVLHVSLTKHDRFPFMFAILIYMAAILLLVGFCGGINGFITMVNASEMFTGAQKARTYAISVSYSLYVLSFTFLFLSPYMVFILASQIVWFYRRPNISAANTCK